MPPYPAITFHDALLLLVASLCLVFLPAGSGVAEGKALPQVHVETGSAQPVCLRVNGEAIAPLFYAANNQFGRDDVLCEGIRIAASQGVNCFTFNVHLPWFENADITRAKMDRLTSANPDGYFLVRVWMGPPQDWRDAHPDDMMTQADGRSTSFVSLASATWRHDASDQLRSLVEDIASSPHASHFLGVMLCFLNTGEWFPPDTESFDEYSKVNEAAFAAWEARHGEQPAPGVAIPSPELRDAAVWGGFRNPARQHAAIDYERYWSELTVDTIAQFAQVVKSATGERSLVGVFYGYTFELNHNGPRALAHSGHSALARLLDVPAIDFISAPYSYYERGPGQPAHFHLPVDSLALHGKLALMEDDTYTDLAMKPSDLAIAPGWHDRAGDRDTSLELVRRNAALFAAHRSGWWLFDLLSDSRWNDASFWQAIRPSADTLSRLQTFSPRIAFLPNEAAIGLLADVTHPELLQSLGFWRHEVARVGEPVGYYLQSDLGRLPDSLRLAILPNAYIVTPGERAALDALVARGGTVVWTYAPGLFDHIPGAEDTLDAASLLERVARCTGFPIVDGGPGPIELTPESGGEAYATGSAPWRARLAIAPGDYTCLARYADSGAVAVASRRDGMGHVVYSAVPRLSSDLLRKLLAETGP